jgi:hypothetical protein
MVAPHDGREVAILSPGRDVKGSYVADAGWMRAEDIDATGALLHGEARL